MRISRCRVCDSTDLQSAINFGEQPWCNNFLRAEAIGSEPYYPLNVVQCMKCATAQLDFTVPKEVMFSDHTYLSGTTASLSRHFETVARAVDTMFFCDQARKSVLDIGSNDGTQLKAFQKLGYDVLGIESSRTAAALANAAGISTLHAFFNESTARALTQQFDVINAAGVFFHLEELHSVCEGIRQVLKPKGVFVVQSLYMKSIVENTAFDQIYHEHLLYYTIRSLEALLKLHDLEIFDAWVSDIHGGSLMAMIGHAGLRQPTDRVHALKRAEDQSRINEASTYAEFGRRIEQMRARDVEYLEGLSRTGKRVFGLGAPAKGNTLLNYFQVGPTLLECLVERNDLRRGLFSPGMHIPVRIEDELSGPPDAYYVLAWNFRKEILQRHSRDVANGVDFYFPVQTGTAS
jgi:SAM-dependent methyltransferase